MTVKELRDKGYKVRVFHQRREAIDWQGEAIPYSFATKGGRTVIQIFAPGETKEWIEGVARCSERDNYNKKLGVRIALGRALKQAPELLQ